MGVLVPLPSSRPAWLMDDRGYLHYLRPHWPWLCLYCHTVQPGDAHHCRNCGAPKQPPEEQA